MERKYIKPYSSFLESKNDDNKNDTSIDKVKKINNDVEKLKNELQSKLNELATACNYLEDEHNKEIGAKIKDQINGNYLYTVRGELSNFQRGLNNLIGKLK